MDFQGLHSNHCYSVLATHTFNLPGGTTARLVLLRNPWGKDCWKGRWGNNDRAWTYDMLRQVGGRGRVTLAGYGLSLVFTCVLVARVLDTLSMRYEHRRSALHRRRFSCRLWLVLTVLWSTHRPHRTTHGKPRPLASFGWCVHDHAFVVESGVCVGSCIPIEHRDACIYTCVHPAVCKGSLCFPHSLVPPLNVSAVHLTDYAC